VLFGRYGEFLSVLDVLKVTYAMRPVEAYIPTLEDNEGGLLDSGGATRKGQAGSGNNVCKVGIIREKILLELTDREIDFVLHVSEMK
jgi:hypothetical protein